MKPTITVSVAAFTVAALAAGSYALAQFPRTQSPAGAKVYFIQPKDGQSVKGQVHVVMGLAGMGIAPAGIESPVTGHHHVLIDVDKLNTNAPVQLVLGDGRHIPHNPPVMSQKITISVTRGADDRQPRHHSNGKVKASSHG